MERVAALYVLGASFFVYRSWRCKSGIPIYCKVDRLLPSLDRLHPFLDRLPKNVDRISGVFARLTGVLDRIPNSAANPQ